jgi:exopolysaccharide biosynthesis polyprenyl glycosylphosphotransferase
MDDVRSIEEAGRDLSSAHSQPSVNLRRRLLFTDHLALILAWLPCALIGAFGGYQFLEWTGIYVAAVGIGSWLLHANEMYLARVSSVRAVELSRLFRVTAMLFVLMVLVLRVTHIETRLREVAVASVLTLLFLVIGRSAYRAWIANARRNNRFIRRVLVIGTNQEAAEFVGLIRDHPETGFRISGVVGDRDDAIENNLMHLWLGVAEDATAELRGSDVNGVVLMVSALESAELNELVRELQTAQVHIHLSNGVRGINYRRLRAAPIVHEPLFYVEQSTLHRHQLMIKRGLDIVGAGLAMLVFSPLFLLIALLVKLNDRGPIFFGQVRVGRDGRQFKVWKFRTMVVDAEARLRDLKQTNERTGPLFKMERDPRVTKIGHLLRETSLDEMPQLFNVLKGEMSLVGPRPALPEEVEQFDRRLLDRTKVRPGITGLWQVEARDNPSFSAYRRLDLFYVDNWSVSLDLVIILATVEQVAAKAVRTVLRKRPAASNVTTVDPGAAAGIEATNRAA